IPLVIGIILSVIFYGITLLLTRVRIISMMISALTPVILFVMSLVMVNFDLVNLNIVFSGTIIGIIVNGVISFMLKNKFAYKFIIPNLFLLTLNHVKYHLFLKKVCFQKNLGKLIKD